MNGKELVSPYAVQDLKYHVKVLAEQVVVYNKKGLEI
jgi:hypothetical protein